MELTNQFRAFIASTGEAIGSSTEVPLSEQELRIRLESLTTEQRQRLQRLMSAGGRSLPEVDEETVNLVREMAEEVRTSVGRA